MMIGRRTCPRLVGEALSLPKLTQLGGSLNVERLRRSGRLRAAPTGAFVKNEIQTPENRSLDSKKGEKRKEAKLFCAGQGDAAHI